MCSFYPSILQLNRKYVQFPFQSDMKLSNTFTQEEAFCMQNDLPLVSLVIHETENGGECCDSMNLNRTNFRLV